MGLWISAVKKTSNARRGDGTKVGKLSALKVSPSPHTSQWLATHKNRIPGDDAAGTITPQPEGGGM
jgi:hypothetical protein